MNNRNQQTNRTPAPAQQSLPALAATQSLTYLNVFIVEEYDNNGTAFPHKDGIGFSIELKAFPIDGRLVVLPPADDDSRNGK